MPSKKPISGSDLRKRVTSFVSDNQAKINAYCEQNILGAGQKKLYLTEYGIRKLTGTTPKFGSWVDIPFDSRNSEAGWFKGVRKTTVGRFGRMRKFLRGEPSNVCSGGISWRNAELLEKLIAEDKLDYCYVRCFADYQHSLAGHDFMCYAVLGPDKFDLVAVSFRHKPQEQLQEPPQTFFKSTVRIELDALIACEPGQEKRGLEKVIREFLGDTFATSNGSFHAKTAHDNGSVLLLHKIEQESPVSLTTEEALLATTKPTLIEITKKEQKND